MTLEQSFWNFFFTLLYGAFLTGAVWFFYTNNRIPVEISLFDVALISLATFRLVRLVTKDIIFQFVRDFFLVSETVTDGTSMVVIKQKPMAGINRTISELLACPWCIGVWLALLVSFGYFYSPLFWYPLLVLAIAGLASLLQVLSNMIGWRAEYYKQKVEGN